MKDWITKAHAARVLGVHRECADRVMAEAGVRVYRLPGTNPRFHRGDVEEVRRKAIGGGRPRPSQPKLAEAGA
jgi:hypothetical protein